LHLRHIFVALVTIAVKTSQPNVVFFRTATLCDWYDVIEFDLVVSDVFSTVLAGMIVSTDNPHLDGE